MAATVSELKADREGELVSTLVLEAQTDACATFWMKQGMCCAEGYPWNKHQWLSLLHFQSCSAIAPLRYQGGVVTLK